ncbi:hypothetical protein ScPMuIL_010731 [Solemya velum]
MAESTQQAGTSATKPEFVDIHKNQALPVTKYLSNEDIERWHSSHGRYNIGRGSSYHLPTRACIETLRRVWYYGWATVVGGCAEGKTYTIGYVIEQLSREPKVPDDPNFFHNKRELEKGIAEKGRNKYTVLRISSPEEWKSKVKLDAYQLVIIDDIFGPACLTLDKVEQWQHLFDEMVILPALSQNKLKVVVSYNRTQERRMPLEYHRYLLFQDENVLDIDDYRYRIDREERKEIYCRFTGKSSNRFEETIEEMNFHNVHSCFPFVLSLYTYTPSLRLRGIEFLSNPIHCLQDLTDKLIEFDPIMFYTMAFCVFMDGDMDLSKADFTDYNTSTQYILNQLRQIIPIPDNTDMGMLRFAAEKLQSFCLYSSQTHTKGNYIFPHERYMQVASTAIFKRDPQRFLQLCSLDCLCERVRTPNSVEMDNASLDVRSSEYEALAQRYTYEVLSGHVKRIVSLPCCHDQNFGKFWATFMEDMGSTEDILRQEDDHGKTFLFWIAYYGCYELMKSFIQADFLEDIREEDWFKNCLKQGITGAASSSFVDSIDAVKFYIENGISANQIYVPDENEDIDAIFSHNRSHLIQMEATPIHYAAQSGRKETLGILVAAGADINSVSKDGFTPLHRSVLQKYALTTKTVLELKADVNIKCPNGITPLMEACLHGNCDAGNALYEASDKEMQVEPHPVFGSALRCSILSGMRYMTKELMDRGVRKFNVKEDAWPPLHHAVVTPELAFVESIVTKGLPLEGKGQGGLTPLHLAVVFNNHEIVSRLLSMKAQVDSKTTDGKTALHLAAELGLYRMCNRLLDNGASPDEKTYDGYYPLNLAAKNGHLSVVILLLEEGLETDLPADATQFFEENAEFLAKTGMMGPMGMRGPMGMMGGPMGMMNPERMMMMMMMMDRKSRGKRRDYY